MVLKVIRREFFHAGSGANGAIVRDRVIPAQFVPKALTSDSSWKGCSGLPAPAALWRDLGPRFGLWNSVYRRFRRWPEKGVFESLFKLLSPDPDFEYAIIDGTIVRVH